MTAHCAVTTVEVKDMFRPKLLAGVFILLFLPFLTGCGNKENIKKVDLNKIEEIKTAPEEVLKISIGLIPEQDIRIMAARYEPLAAYLSKRLGLKVTLVYLDNYGELCDKFIYKQLDAAFFGSFGYALTHAKAQVEPIARPDYQGVSTYRGLIIVRGDSNIKNAADMRGKRIVLVHQATYAGYLYPLAYFKEQGIERLEKYFSGITFAGSHDKAIFALLRGEADVAVPKDLVYQRVIKENPDLEKKLVVLAASNPVPSNTLCVRKDLEPVSKNRLKDVLLNLDKDEEAKPALAALGADKFVETKDEDYRYLYETIKILEIDLNVYPYYERPDMGFNAGENVQESK